VVEQRVGEGDNMRWSPTSPIAHRRRIHWPAGWLWLAESAISWVLVVAAGYGLMALAVHLASD
jgi:hypothetical protein